MEKDINVLLKQLSAYTSDFEPISLQETSAIELMNRFDAKYTFSMTQLEALLHSCSDSYYVMKEEGNTVFPYKNLYLDTPDNDLFLAHQNGRLHRYKVRLREYVGFNLVYLEIKEKYKGKTQKVRMKLTGMSTIEDCLLDQFCIDTMAAFIQKNSPLTYSQLQPALQNTFYRITLVHRSKTERLTLDVLLQNSWNGRVVTTPYIVIAEIKHQQGQPVYPFQAALKSKGIRTGSYSKYCIGSLQTETVNKYNTFKETLLRMERLQYE